MVLRQKKQKKSFSESLKDFYFLREELDVWVQGPAELLIIRIDR